MIMKWGSQTTYVYIRFTGMSGACGGNVAQKQFD